jgi:hypothetical protein
MSKANSTISDGSTNNSFMDRFKGKITLMPKKGIHEIIRRKSVPIDNTINCLTKTTNDMEISPYSVRNHEIPSIDISHLPKDRATTDPATPISLKDQNGRHIKTLFMEDGKIPSPVYSNETTCKAHTSYVYGDQRQPNINSFSLQGQIGNNFQNNAGALMPPLLMKTQKAKKKTPAEKYKEEQGKIMLIESMIDTPETRLIQGRGGKMPSVVWNLPESNAPARTKPATGNKEYINIPNNYNQNVYQNKSTNFGQGGIRDHYNNHHADANFNNNSQLRDWEINHQHTNNSPPQQPQRPPPQNKFAPYVSSANKPGSGSGNPNLNRRQSRGGGIPYPSGPSKSSSLKRRPSARDIPQSPKKGRPSYNNQNTYDNRGQSNFQPQNFNNQPGFPNSISPNKPPRQSIPTPFASPQTYEANYKDQNIKELQRQIQQYERLLNDERGDLGQPFPLSPANRMRSKKKIIGNNGTPPK